MWVCFKRANIFLALSCLLSVPALGERLDLRSGEAVQGSEIEFRDGTFRVPGEKGEVRSIARDAVNDWWIRSEDAWAEQDVAVAESAAHAGDSRERLSEARRRGQEFADEFPGSKGVIVKDEGTFRLTKDHRHVYRYHFIGLMLGEDTLDWAQLQLGFTKGRSRQTIIAARCLTPGGVVTSLAPADVKTGKPGRGAVHFDPNSRSLSAAIPGAEVGGVVEYIYEYEAYNPEDWRMFSPGFHFQMDVPCLHSRLEVRVPEGQDLYWWSEDWEAAGATVASGRQETAEQEEEDGEVLYAWEKESIPPVLEEPRMPDRSEVVPRVYASLFEDWSYLNDWIGSLQQERMTATEAVREQADAIVGDLVGPEEIIAALYHWVQKNIRYISIKSSLSSGWSGHPAEETLEQGYGDCTDKSVLLATMLQHHGFDAQPLVVRTNDRGDFVPEHPYLACNHAITVTELDGRKLYLDSTTQDHRFPALRADNHGVIGYNFIEGTRNRIPVPEGGKAHAKRSDQTMNLRADGLLECRTENAYAGQYEAGLRGTWKRVPEAMKAPFMQQYLSGISAGASLVDFSMTDPQDLDVPFEMQFHYRVPRYVEQAGEVRVFQLPNREQQFAELSVESRRYPIVYTTTRREQRSVEVNVPEQWRVLAVPEDADVQSPYVRYSEKFSRDGQSIRMEIVLEFLERRVPVEDCPDFLDALRRITSLSRRPLYFESKDSAIEY